MKIIDTKFEKAKLIIPDVFYDFRGEYLETFNKENYKALNVPDEFIQDDISISYKHVLRGFHGDFKTWKLVQCVYGSIYVVIIDNNKESKTYYQWQAFTLNDKNRYQLLVPPGFGNSLLAMTDIIVYSYKQTTYYERASQFTIAPFNPYLGIYWPIAKENIIISERDRNA